MPKALVTGANGFIGSNLSALLLRRGWEVTGLVLEGTLLDFLEGLDIDIVYGDILKPAALAGAARDADAVFHLAGIARDWGPEELFTGVNAHGTRNMLEACVKDRARRFVFLSSVAVHRYDGHYGSDENTPADCAGDFHYGRSKIRAEGFVREFIDRGLLEGVIIRPGIFPFGPHDTTSFYRLARALEKGMFFYVNGGRARLTTAYVENLCHGLELAGRIPRAAGQTYIIADDVEVSWKTLIEMFCRELGAGLPRRSIPYPAADLAAAAAEKIWALLKFKGQPPVTRYRARLMYRDLVFTAGKAKHELGYSPPVPLEEGVKRTVEWYKRARGKYD